MIYLIVLLPISLLLVGAFIFDQLGRHRAFLISMLTAWLGQILVFLSWFFSRWPIDASKSTRMWVGQPSVAKAGFPLHGLELPPSPLGGGYESIDRLDVVLTNQLFWFFIAFLVVFWFTRRIPKGWWKQAPMFFVPTAFLVSAANLILFGLWFD